MKLNYAVTFEFDERAPVTVRGTVEAGSLGPAGRMAINEASTQAGQGKRGWRSVCVLLDRGSVEAADGE